MESTIDTMNRWGASFNRHLSEVREETQSWQQAQALRAKWGEANTQDAISREAKARTVKECK